LLYIYSKSIIGLKTSPNVVPDGQPIGTPQ